MSKSVRHNAEMKARLIGEIQSLLEPCGIKRETVVTAVEKSLREIKRNGSSVQTWLLPLTFWKIFKSKGFLLINPKTPTGNVIPFDVLIAAYAIWREAQQKAVTCGLDELDAVNALIRVVNVLTDRRARGNCTKINNLSRYMFAGYMRELKRIVEKIGVVHPRNLDGKEPDSDDGAFFDALENAILYDEAVCGLSAKEEAAVTFRYVKGYSFEETAEIMGLSNNAVRQLLTRARRKLREIYGKNGRRIARKRQRKATNERR